MVIFFCTDDDGLLHSPLESLADLDVVHGDYEIDSACAPEDSACAAAAPCPALHNEALSEIPCLRTCAVSGGVYAAEAPCPAPNGASLAAHSVVVEDEVPADVGHSLVQLQLLSRTQPNGELGYVLGDLEQGFYAVFVPYVGNRTSIHWTKMWQLTIAEAEEYKCYRTYWRPSFDDSLVKKIANYGMQAENVLSSKSPPDIGHLPGKEGVQFFSSAFQGAFNFSRDTSTPRVSPPFYKRT